MLDLTIERQGRVKDLKARVAKKITPGTVATWDGKSWIRERPRVAWLELVVLTKRGEFRQEVVDLQPTLRDTIGAMTSGAGASRASLTLARLAVKAGGGLDGMLAGLPATTGAKRTASSTRRSPGRSARSARSRRG